MMSGTAQPDIVIREARESDVPLILQFIRELAEYEKLSEYVDRKSTRLNSSHIQKSRMPSSA